jgi:UDP-N-acetylglucosamine 1-carboxyvinyltransferase
MAAVLAKGKTRIYNAACEPYLQQLCRMLNRMGAKIEGIGSNLLTIEGVSQLRYRTHHASRYGRNWFLDWSCCNDKI